MAQKRTYPDAMREVVHKVVIRLEDEREEEEMPQETQKDEKPRRNPISRPVVVVDDHQLRRHNLDAHV